MSDAPDQYVVIARRYRPQTFTELVGQGHIGQALGNAINTNRVGHAYLFTGARGVGKTSTARILAKCLNCVDGPTPNPCDQCDPCQSITSGEDVDVLEIDGASNRGIDEIRQLRSNVNIRPSRSRYKIYIIDEVHMLTNAAFNALLKTLEEPPEHVKFIFCTTDPEKIPITVLSRCQRFDFAPVETDSIVDRLEHIVRNEGVEADDEALQLLARRAGGSMRDSQSLLEQLLAFCDQRITLDDVHQMLGTAGSAELAELVSTLTERDTAGTLKKLDELVSGGADAGQIAEQLLGWFRDMMAVSVGCEAELMLSAGPGDYDAIAKLGEAMGLETMLAVAQILDESLVRMRQSTHVRTLLEIALVRICKLEDLDGLAELISQLKSGTIDTSSAPAPAAKQKKTAPPKPPQKKSPSADTTPQPISPPAGTIELTDENVESAWKEALASMEDTTSDFASHYDRLAISAPNQLAVTFKAEYTLHKERCERPELRQRLEQAVSELTGQRIRIDFRVEPSDSPQPKTRKPVMTKRQKMREFEKHPLIREAIELFDAEVIDFEQQNRSQ